MSSPMMTVAPAYDAWSYAEHASSEGDASTSAKPKPSRCSTR